MPSLATSTPAADAPRTLRGTEAHAHARAVLGPALPPEGRASHSYLFHGPPGTGKRTVARAFAAELLADGAPDPEAARERVARGVHPDLTWVTPSGSNEMLVGDVEEAVVGAVARTPFEARRRVWVIEGAQTMSDQVANRLLKTLEEPPSFAHLILLANRVQDVLPTISSRCQAVRFDPLPSARIEERLGDGAGGAGGDPRQRRACARLALGDAGLAALLASAEGEGLRASAERLVRGALRARTGERGWLGVLEQAKAAGGRAGEQLQERLAGEGELLPVKERRRHQREALEAQRRVERRERTRALDLALHLAELWLRDVWCIAEGASELVYAVDRMEALREDAANRRPARLRGAVELVAQTRARLPLNVSEELALEALAYRLEELLGASTAEGASTAGHPPAQSASASTSTVAEAGAASSGATRLPTASRSTTTVAR